MLSSENKIKRPNFFKLITEPSRALIELGIFFPIRKLSKNQKGDGHAVMVMPGFMTSEKSTKVLRKFLESLGYKVYDWGLGRNLGKLEYLEVLLERTDEIYEKEGTPISLIGWSLGGVFARQIAKEKPHIIRQVITLGSPFAGLAEPNNAAWIFSILNGGKKVANVNHTLLEDLPNPAPVPTTAIYSKEDGIVNWQMCIEKVEDATHQNIQVHGSHLGLGVNYSVLSIIANRLKQEKNNWTKLNPSGFFDNKMLFPSL